MTDAKILQIFNWYKLEMRAVGRRVEFPECGDKKKTYLWRQLENFANKMEEFGLDDAATRKMMNIIIRYCKSKRLLNRGASILVKSDMLEICHNKLVEELKEERAFINDLNRCALFLRDQRERESEHDVLLIRKKQLAYSNMTCWFQTGKLTKAFIALSRSCCRALSKLSEGERNEFPSDIELLRIRMNCLRDTSRLIRIIEIIGADLNRRL